MIFLEIENYLETVEENYPRSSAEIRFVRMFNINFYLQYEMRGFDHLIVQFLALIVI